jgi:hypothetical protein
MFGNKQFYQGLDHKNIFANFFQLLGPQIRLLRVKNMVAQKPEILVLKKC